jgi:hypothetical protein
MISLAAKGRSDLLHKEVKDQYATISVIVKEHTDNGISGMCLAHSGRNSSCQIPYYQFTTNGIRQTSFSLPRMTYLDSRQLNPLSSQR